VKVDIQSDQKMTESIKDSINDSEEQRINEQKINPVDFKQNPDEGSLEVVANTHIENINMEISQEEMKNEMMPAEAELIDESECSVVSEEDFPMEQHQYYQEENRVPE